MTTLTSFFATRGDMALGLNAIGTSLPIEFVRAGMFPTPEIYRVQTYESIPDFGICTTGDQYEHSYLVVNRGAEIVPEKIPQLRGGVLYAVDHRLNAGMIFRPGGKHGNGTIIAGEFGTPRTDAQTQLVLKAFRRYFLNSTFANLVPSSRACELIQQEMA